MITLGELIFRLPHAVEWVQMMEGTAWRRGTGLSVQELRIAQKAGVEEILAVSKMRVREIKFPPNLARLVDGIFPRQISAITFGHSIFWTDDSDVIAHELKHVEQYERLGGIEPFLRQYLSECIRFGYEHSPLEKEAIEFAEEVSRPLQEGKV